MSITRWISCFSIRRNARVAVLCTTALSFVLGALPQHAAAQSAPPPPMMALPDKIDVSSTGAATYSIPIMVPPGTAGMQPKISLDYNSQASNGIAGVGWTIGGLLTVDRCPQTIAQDGPGHMYDVHIGSSDRFCVDGQRLDASDSIYGLPGTEYRTERESFTKFVSNDWWGSGVGYFTARTKDGQYMEFGNTWDSKVEVENTFTLRAWAVNKVRDTAGNYMSVTYAKHKINGDFWPTRIDYTGNATASLTPYASVRFVYDDRTDSVRQYAAGNMVLVTKRLAKIQTYLGETLVSEYRLTYDTSPASGRARLTSIAMCAADSSCLPATTFTYGNGGYGPGGGLSFTKTNNALPLVNLNGANQVHFGDWNGDGITDMMSWDFNNGKNNWYLNTSSGSTTTFNTIVNPITLTDINDGGQLIFGDWNGDGATDMLWWDAATGTNRWYVSNRAIGGTLAFTKYENKIAKADIKNPGAGYRSSLQAGDWNGDGITDVMFFEAITRTNTWFINQGMTPTGQNFAKVVNPIPASQLAVGTLYFGDWNADGITDMMLFVNGGNVWFFNNSGGHPSSLAFSAPQTNLIPVQEINDGQIYIVDWNNDGLSDLVFWNKSNGTNRWYANKGKDAQASPVGISFVKYESPIPTAPINGGTGIFFGDWNGDSIPDLMWWKQSSGANRWYVSNGGAGGTLSFTLYDNPISTVDMTGATIEGGTGTQFVDWNGDGLPDVMWWDRGNGANRWFANNASKPDLMTTVTSGLGIGTTVTYDRLTKGAPFYTRDTNAVRPTIDFSGSTYVVKRIDRGDGIGGTRSMTYRYAGAKIDVQGRGSLGFRTVVARDEQTTIEESTTYRQDWPFTGLVSSVVRTLGAIELSRIENTLAADALTGIRKFIKLTQSVELAKDLNGTALPSVTKTFQYDAYGNVTQSTVAASDGYSSTTVNTYINDAVNWLLGRLTRSTVTSVTP